MKTLVNKDNPQIRITAEVETLYDKSRCVKYYYVKDLRLGLLQENWTLVEQEQQMPNSTQLIAEWEKEVDLEKEIEKEWVEFGKYNYAVFKRLLRKYYKLGRKGGNN